MLMAAGGPSLAADLPQVSHDGMYLAPDTEVAAAYIKPEADFSGYERIMLLDAHVAFVKNWQMRHNSSSVNKVTNRDLAAIKSAMAELFREVFVGEFDGKGGYSLVDAPDTDVLLLRPAIVDLDVTAPDLPRGSRSYSFSASAGAATLYLEVYDSVSGEILARVIDRQAAKDVGGVMQWSNKITNRVAAERILQGWARLLRERLDEVRAAASSAAAQ